MREKNSIQMYLALNWPSCPQDYDKDIILIYNILYYIKLVKHIPGSKKERIIEIALERRQRKCLEAKVMNISQGHRFLVQHFYTWNHAYFFFF